MTLSFDDESLPQSQAVAELIAGGIEFELVHGGMENIQGRSFETFTPGSCVVEDAAVDLALGRLSELRDLFWESVVKTRRGR